MARKLISIRELGVEVAERVVRERGEVDDGVEAREFVCGHVADVELERRQSGLDGAEIAAAVEERVEPGHVVPGRDESRPGHRAEVAVVAGDEDFQREHVSSVPHPRGTWSSDLAEPAGDPNSAAWSQPRLARFSPCCSRSLRASQSPSRRRLPPLAALPSPSSSPSRQASPMSGQPESARNTAGVFASGSRSGRAALGSAPHPAAHERPGAGSGSPQGAIEPASQEAG